ncbi:condensin subunit Smc [Thermosyntropha lipolytica DSM 11003]|uniref:Chromosome partition protein Smc n=1 Tax=Thermosyntropha lipolytica DSM 11003 TaxID=1123382 RepID=A0A1M5PIG1_9FIRM|nr:chromosome segregation protein SMC [Thermosyntropha lipolytica]SHH01594.1 condensin subunit Smc [Thermosyntropha lipolytica DSM 11003]
MYLKKIEMKGFKSFAEHTEIIFKPGINVVVGPNGCGKSNLVDAVRWVLGENNIRELRGQKSEDVIFNGTDKFRALSMASVEIVLDNADGLLPLDYSEVAVGRKIFRSGESEFYLNKARVRLKDINKVFTGTGLGKCGYSIIGQGELEEVLNGAPMDRRLILEEASGIIKYRQQRDEVKARIASTSSDLVRIGDILGELKKQRDELHKKAEKAELYLRLREEFKDLQYKVSLFEIKKLTDHLSEQEKRWEEKNEKLTLLLAELKDREKRWGEEEKLLFKQREYLEKYREEKHGLENEINELQNLINLSGEKIKNKEERIRAARKDQVKYKDMLQGIEKELAKLERDYEEAEKEYEEKKCLFAGLTSKLKELEGEIEEEHRDFEKRKELVFKAAEEAAGIKNRLRSGEERLKKLKEKRERMAVRQEEIEERWQKQKEEINFLNAKKAKDEKLILQLETELAELEEKRGWLLKEVERTAGYLDTLNRKQSETVQKIIHLENIRRNFTGYSSGVRFIMQNKESLSGILGILGELITIPAGLETAVEEALGKGQENVVVDKAVNAEKAIDFLKRNNAGRVTFLPLDMLKAGRIPDEVAKKITGKDGVLGIASQLVKYDPFYAQAVEYLLGRVVVVRDIKTGVALFRSLDYPLRIVSLEGEVINGSGAMTGGSRKEGGKTPIQYRSEENKLKAEKEKLEREIFRAGEALERVKGELRKIDEVIEDKKKTLAEVSFTLDMLIKNLEEAEGKKSWLEKEKNAILQEEALMTEEIKRLEEEMQGLYCEHKEKEFLSEEREKELEALKISLEEKKRDWGVYKERLKAYQEQIEMKAKECAQLKHNLEQFKRVEDSYRKSLAEAVKLEERIAEEIKQEEKVYEEAQRKLKDRLVKLSQVNQNLAKERAREEETRRNIEELKMLMNPLREDINRLEKELKNLEIAKARLETELEAAKARFVEDFKKPVPSEIGEIHTSRENSEYRQRMESLKSRIEDMGTVDVEAINAYQELKNRFDFMQEQYDDLNRGKEALEKLLKETEELMHREFISFLDQANKSFKKTFTEIFGGGDAVLRLENAEDKLSAGVEIEVKMPGKKTQALSLLSGGERALTCIAFIFALLRLKPVPFCLLDEIDAALDETNLTRFARFIRKMAEEVQFIIISHRQAMMEAGEIVYGITMPEKGVSSVLTLSMNDIESRAG